jgi:hypothetical protein
VDSKYLLPTFLLVILMIGIVAETQHLASGFEVIGFALAGAALYVHARLKHE